MTGRQRPPALAALAIILALMVVSSCGQSAPEEVDSEAAVSVKTARATLGTLRGVVHATGIVSPAPGAELMVVAPEPARIAEVPHAPGDRVRKGDLLVRFDIPNAAAEVRRQQAEVGRAQVALESARAAQTRARELFDRGVAARREVEEADRALADADAALEQARASLAAARSVAGRSVVRATFNGLIARRLHNPGDLVEPSANDPVLQVIDPRRLEVVASIPLAAASRVRVGAPARLVAAPINTGGITLRALSRPAAVDPGTATVPVRLGFASAVEIPTGTPVQVDIEAEERKGVVMVPASAIVRDGEDTTVFVARDGRALRRDVQLGITDGTNVEIRSGVKSGDMVVVSGQAGLPDKAAITVSPGASAEPTGVTGADRGSGA